MSSQSTFFSTNSLARPLSKIRLTPAAIKAIPIKRAFFCNPNTFSVACMKRTESCYRPNKKGRAKSTTAGSLFLTQILIFSNPLDLHFHFPRTDLLPSSRTEQEGLPPIMHKMKRERPIEENLEKSTLPAWQSLHQWDFQRR